MIWSAISQIEMFQVVDLELYQAHVVMANLTYR